MEDDLKRNFSATTDRVFLKFWTWAEGTKPKLNLDWNEDDLKILKVEYASTNWSDLTQILNLSLTFRYKKTSNLNLN